MTADLLIQQNQLLEQLFAKESPDHRGLQAYRANGSELAARVLTAAYPTIQGELGEESFAQLAKHLWRPQPPVRGDLAQWGGGLADFLRGQPDLMANEPHLPEVAELDWALHTAAYAADGDTPDALMPLQVCTVRGQNFLVYRQGFKPQSLAITPEQAQSLFTT